jgi:hypothetical protein
VSSTATRPPRRAGRPPKIAGTAHRWWVYCSREARTAAEARAKRDGHDLGDVLRAFLDDYAAGSYAPPSLPEVTR